MNLFEAIHLLRHPYEDIEENPAARTAFWQAATIVESSASYRRLTLVEGQSLAQAALALFDTGVNADHYYPLKILTNLANVVPGSLVGLYSDLLARDLYWSEGAMFREADPATRDRIINLIDVGERDSTVNSVYTPDRLLCMLSWIGDEAVQEMFVRWRQTPPLGVMQPEYYLHEAAWELTALGQRRDLF